MKHWFGSSVLCVAVAAAVSGCMVVPLDPRTGQPYVAPASDAGSRHTTVIATTSAAPPQASVLQARLYPLNAQANQGGLLTAVVVDAHTGRGTLSFQYRGDALQGEATRVDASYASFGRLHAEVLGPTPRAFSGQRGIANAFGAKGVNAQCEYLLTGPSQGTGVCLFSDGAKYQIHFGT